MNAKLKLLMATIAAVVLSACASNSTDEEVVYDDAATYEETTSAVDTGSVVDSGFDADPEAGLDTVFYFEFDSSSLTYQARAALDAYAAVLSRTPRSIRLEGHADERGTREYNIALGERRAKAVSDYLTTSGVSSSIIETISYGEERPAVSGSGDSAWSQNRRVELK